MSLDTQPIIDGIVSTLIAGTYNGSPIKAEEFEGGELREQRAYVIPTPGFETEDTGEGWYIVATLWQILLVTTSTSRRKDVDPAVANDFCIAVLEALQDDPTLDGSAPAGASTPIEVPLPELNEIAAGAKARKMFRRYITLRVDH